MHCNSTWVSACMAADTCGTMPCSSTWGSAWLQTFANCMCELLRPQLQALPCCMQEAQLFDAATQALFAVCCNLQLKCIIAAELLLLLLLLLLQPPMA